MTEIEGTTRDTIEEYISIKGIPLKIVDTAGIRNAKDEVEKIGVKKSLNIIEKSDIVIAIFDIRRKLNKEDFEILELIKNKKSIIILNKIDLKKDIISEEIKNINNPIIKLSTKTGEGLEDLYSEIEKIFNLNEIANSGETIVSNKRHKFLIKNARENIKKCQDTIKDNMPIDVISSIIREILENLGEITGESVTEDIINEIFSKFCLGK